LLTSVNWNWIFLINLPIGLIVLILSMKLLSPKDRNVKHSKQLDVGGAVSVTSALLIAVYTIQNGNEFGWLSARTLGQFALAAVVFTAFIYIEKRVRHPLVQLSLFKNRNLTVSNSVGVLWTAAMFAWFFISALYMQLILHYSPLKVGLAFLPANIIMGAFSIGISARLVSKFGVKKPLSIGLLLAGVGLFLFAFAPVKGLFLIHLLPGMVLLGVGAGMGFNPVLLAAMDGVKPSDAGLASGLVNTSFMMGGALGLAILASIAAANTEHLISSGHSQLVALNGGYHLAFIVGACSAVLASTIGWIFLRPTASSPSSSSHN
jgi:MFS family permease